MASSTRVLATEVTGLYRALLETMSRRTLGQVPEVAGVMWHHPAVLEDSMAVGRKVDSWHRLDPNPASFAAMAAAGVVGCSTCLDLHHSMTHDRGLDEAKAREVPKRRERIYELEVFAGEGIAVSLASLTDLTDVTVA